MRADLGQRLQVAQLQRGRVAGDHVGGVAEALRSLELALGVDDLRPPLALGLGAERHRVLHRGRDLDVLDLDGRDLDPPRVGVLVDDVLERLVELLPLAQQHVEIGLAQHRAQRRLGDLRGRHEEALDVDDRARGVDHAEVADRVHLGGHVVTRDQVLRRDVERHRAQVHAHHPVDGRDQQDQPRALHAEQAAEPEHDGALVLAQDPDRGGGERSPPPTSSEDDETAAVSWQYLPFLGPANRQRQAMNLLHDDVLALSQRRRPRRPTSAARATARPRRTRRRSARPADDADAADQARPPRRVAGAG